MAAPLFAQDAVSFRRELKEGSQDVYKLTSNISFVPGDGAPMPGGAGSEPVVTTDMEMMITFLYGKPVDGKAPLDITVKKGKIEIGGMFGSMMQGMMNSFPEQLKATASINDRNVISDFKILTQGQGMAMQMTGLSEILRGMNGVEFPANAVVPGTTWTVDVPKAPSNNNQGAKLTARLVGEKELGGVPTWQVEVTGKVPLGFDSSMMPPDADASMMGEMSMTGDTTFTSVVLVEKTGGRVASVETSGTITMNVDAGGNVFPLKGQTKSAIVLQRS